jgi:hypothetical protein
LHTTHGFAKGLVDARLVTATTGSHLHRPRPAHDLWAVLIARIYEVFPLLCPICGGQMRIIAFITHSADIRHILDHIGADSGPPLWDDCGDAPGEEMQIGPGLDLVAQPAPQYEVDQRINW